MHMKTQHTSRITFERWKFHTVFSVARIHIGATSCDSLCSKNSLPGAISKDIYFLFLFLSFFFFFFLPGGGAGRRSLLWHLTDVPRTTYTHDTVGNPEDIALGKKGPRAALRRPRAARPEARPRTPASSRACAWSTIKLNKAHCQQQLNACQTSA